MVLIKLIVGMIPLQAKPALYPLRIYMYRAGIGTQSVETKHIIRHQWMVRGCCRVMTILVELFLLLIDCQHQWMVRGCCSVITILVELFFTIDWLSIQFPWSWWIKAVHGTCLWQQKYSCSEDISISIAWIIQIALQFILPINLYLS